MAGSGCCVIHVDAGYIWTVPGVRGWGLAAGPLYSPSPAPHSINNFEHVKWASHQPPARPAPASTGRRSQDTAEQHTGHCGPRGTLALAGGLQVASRRDFGTGIKIVNSDILAAPCDLLAVCVYKGLFPYYIIIFLGVLPPLVVK